MMRRSFSLFNKSYDVAVIGGGPGGYVAAIKAAQLGLNTVCIEDRGSLGGTCLNVGCIPSKALLHATHLYHEAKHSFQKYGITGGENCSVNIDQMMKQKSKVVTQLTSGIEFLFKKNKVAYMKGRGALQGNGQVTITSSKDATTSTISAKNIVLATGSEPIPLPFAPFDEERILSSTGALSLKTVPKRLAVIGGGVIGLEMASVWARLGSKVTVLEFSNTICPFLDDDVSQSLVGYLRSQSITFRTQCKVTNITTGSNNELTLSIESTATGSTATTSTDVLECDAVLVSVGRRAVTKNMGLEAAKVNVDSRGFIIANEKYETNVPGVYAIGDVINVGPMLAHKAEEEGVAVAEILAGKPGHVNYSAIPGVIYTTPEVAWVGKTERDLKKENILYNSCTFPFAANSRAKATDVTDGFVKVLADKSTDRLLGVHIVNASAGEMIHEAVLALEYGASSEDIGRTCHAHPTLMEAVKEACMGCYSKPIHMA